jgi:hypothetical protein
MGPNRRAQERERAATEAAANVRRAEVERKAVADAQKIVAIWNARQAGGRESPTGLVFMVTIGMASILSTSAARGFRPRRRSDIDRSSAIAPAS